MKSSMYLMAGLLTAGLMLAISGCNRHSRVDESEPTDELVQDAVENQQFCPVMDGMAVNRNIYADHDGQRVYFCCPGCVATFEADPEKYVQKVRGMHADADASRPEPEHDHEH